MNFLYPGFLFALLAVAVPVIIHLFNFRKFKKVYFSNVQFLKVVEQQQSSREKLKHLLVLLSRILAVAFLAFAFARPIIPSSNQQNAFSQNLVSIYIDNSYSMEAVNRDGNLLDEAKRKAKELVNTYGVNDKYQLLTNNFEAKHQRFVSAEEFIKALDDVKISSANRTLQQVINRQQSLFTGGGNWVSYIISDFQKNFNDKAQLKTNKQVQTSFVKLQASALPNVSVDSVWMLWATHQPNVSEKLVVQLHNHSEEIAKNIPLKLSINNKQKSISNLTIDAGKTKTDTLSFNGLNLGWQKAELSIKDFPVTFDDTLRFSFKVDKDLKVLNLKGDDAVNYIKPLFAADGYFKLTENQESNINYSGFSNYRLIVLNGLKLPSTGLAQELKHYVKNGGFVVVFPNLDADIASYNQFLTALSLPKIAEINQTATKVNQIDLANPIFKDVFEEIPKNIDLPEVSRYFIYANNNQLAKTDLLKLPANRLFFSQYSVGNGKIYLCASGLDSKDSNLPKHPVFVPLMYKIAFSSGIAQPLFYTNAKDNVLEQSKITLGANQSLKLLANNFDVIPEVKQIEGKTLLYVADQVKHPGFYDLKKADSLLAVFSFNDNRAESDMNYLSTSALEQLTKQNNIKIFDTQTDALPSAMLVKNSGTELWKLCIILSLIFIAAEILLIRYYNKPKNIFTT